MSSPHSFVEAWLRFNYLRDGVTLDDLLACWRSGPHDNSALRALRVHMIHGRTAEHRIAARHAIDFLTQEQK